MIEQEVIDKAITAIDSEGSVPISVGPVGKEMMISGTDAIAWGMGVMQLLDAQEKDKKVRNRDRI